LPKKTIVSLKSAFIHYLFIISGGSTMLFEDKVKSDQLQLELQEREREPSQIYKLSLQSEWQLIRHYSAGDFGDRYGWPNMEPGIRNHFLVDDADRALQ
jgi:hypothetical protein